MGRFETTAQTYAARREPYPPAFFTAAANALNLQGREALIDLGAGPGVLALGFAPYVGRVVGVDPEPAMAAEARRAAATAKVGLVVIEGRAEDLNADVGRFELVTIGRALHWMEREATLATFDRILAPGGRIVICGSRAAGAEVNPWRSAYDAALRSVGEAGVVDHRQVYQHWFDDSRFTKIGEVKVSHQHNITPEALVERALTRSTTSPAVLGAKIEAFRASLLEVLAPFFPDSVGVEIIEATAAIFAAAEPRVEDRNRSR
jgi:SAM-dependent methyltransferase